MPAHIDHLVIAGTDLGALVAWWTSRTGVAPVRGGSHVGYGTRNALVGAGPSSYVELIAPDPAQPEPERARPFGIDELEPFSIRLAAFAVAVPDIEYACARVRAAGLDPGPIRSMERRLTDGSMLRWRLAVPPSPELGGVMPFLIEWAGGSPHPATSLDPAVDIHSVELGHPQAAMIRTALADLGVELTVQETTEPLLSAHLVTAGGALQV
jgi:hypothetical protein